MPIEADTWTQNELTQKEHKAHLLLKGMSVAETMSVQGKLCNLKHLLIKFHTVCKIY
jgi:hypothetical protein